MNDDNNNSSSALPDLSIPYNLMPVAALLGLYIVYAVVHITIIALSSTSSSSSYKNKHERTTARERLLQKQQQQQTTTTTTSSTGFYVLTLILALIAYSFTVARVQAAYQRVEYYDFHPYQILGLSEPSVMGGGAADTSSATTTTTEVLPSLADIQAAFKLKVQQLASSSSSKHHQPQKTASSSSSLEQQQQQLKYAYQALADERGKLSYKKFGHPAGPLEVPAFVVTVPTWLWRPPPASASASQAARMGMYAVYLLAILLVLRALYLIGQKQRALQAARKPLEGDDAALLDDSNSVSAKDLQFLGNHLNADRSTAYDVLWTLCASPANLAWSLSNLKKVEQIKQERLEQEANKQKKKQTNELDFDALVNEGGWDEDDDEDAAGDKAKKNKDTTKTSTTEDATGQNKQLLEGIDEGALGQKWVESTLEKAKQWPPPSIDLWKEIEYQGDPVENVLDHPGLRRMLCMTTGRLNSQMLNGHPELLQAGAKKLIDQTYFKSSMEFRQRAGLMLEAILRLGMSLRSYKLVATTLEAVTLFKVGCHNDADAKKWFNNVMMRQYNCLPRLKVHSKDVVTPDENEVATGDEACFQLEMERTHAENFMKTKIAMCQKQGIPPQVALQNFREGWWLLLRCERLDGPTPEYPIEVDQPFLKEINLDPASLDCFVKENPKYRLVTGSPIIVQNIAQKQGKFAIKFKAPPVPGKYKFTMSIKSQDFIGADQDVEVTTTVVDVAKVKRTPKPKQEEKPEEPKKDK